MTTERLFSLILSLALFQGCTGLTGCNTFQSAPAGDRLIDEVVIPTAERVAAALSEQGFRNGEIEGDARIDDPTYELDIEGYWVTGILIRTRAGVDGINGAVNLRAVSDEEVETSPFNQDRQTTTSP
jgi:hypothetical protein